MDWYLYATVVAFLFGLVIGSFLNVVILRMNTGVTLGGRSRCMSCGHTLAAKELIPFFSYVFQLGRCSECNSRISIQYPLVELVTATLFSMIVYKYLLFSLSQALFTFGLLVATSLLVVMTVYDIRHKILPDILVYSFAGIALLLTFVSIQGSNYFAIPDIWSLLAGPIIAAPFALLWLVSKGRWIGLGDAKLALGIGWLLGLSGGLNAVILAFWIGAVVGVVWMLIAYRRWKSKVEVPFGPFLILGTILVLLFNIQVVNLDVLFSLF